MITLTTTFKRDEKPEFLKSIARSEREIKSGKTRVLKSLKHLRAYNPLINMPRH